MKLDKSRPYGTVFGHADHRYVQDGKKFDSRGEEILPEVPFSPDEPVILPDDEDLSRLHWRLLKSRVEAAGGTWTNKADAVAFLENLDGH